MRVRRAGELAAGRWQANSTMLLANLYVPSVPESPLASSAAGNEKTKANVSPAAAVTQLDVAATVVANRIKLGTVLMF